ncbi:MAG: hypothetical protein EKK37_17855 [Sphingobacteriales bacterium]|nr:MAG: hypothetical protein EKK37_17855 [Sphingobacteriales bacterium]
MTNFSLNPDMNIEVTARLIAKGSDAPVSGKAYNVRLYDKDFFEDDFLGEASPDENGQVKISFNPDDFDTQDVLKEASLDFYFVVYKQDEEIFRSKVMEDIPVERFEKFKMGEGEIFDLGTFLIEA